MENSSITIIGIGNILRKDDGLGVRLVHHLESNYIFSDNISLIDGGTTGMALLSFIEAADYLIVLDAINSDGDPGTIYRYSLEEFRLSIPKKISMHDLGFIEVMAVAELQDILPKEVTIIGAKPLNISEDSTSLTPLIESKIEPITKIVIDKLKEYQNFPEKRTEKIDTNFPFD